jgi:hypothetical protein
LFTLGSVFWYFQKWPRLLGYFVPRSSLDKKKRLGHSLGDFFTNSSGRPGPKVEETMKVGCQCSLLIN